MEIPAGKKKLKSDKADFKNHLEMKTTISEIKNSFSRLFIAEERSSELKNSSEEIIQNVIHKKMKNIESVRDTGYSEKV